MKRIRKLVHRAKPRLRQRYKYDELPRGEYFRYLILHPGADSDPLQCSLHTTHLPSEPPYEAFEAISYVWGTDVKDEKILCDGKVLNITTNLHKVLQRVRRTDAPRKLWADSICINQDDLEEKGHQVVKMGQIYRAAETVLIYIGSDDDGYGPQVCSLLVEVNAMIEDTCSKIDMSWDSFPYPEENDQLLTDTRWTSLHNLLSQDWFQRGWVVREAALARHGEVVWGQSVFAWESLMHTYLWLARRALGAFVSLHFDECFISSHASLFIDRYTSFTKTVFNEDEIFLSSLLTVLEEARFLQLTDPRDRIFAFTDLTLQSGDELHLYPNYQDSHLEVYWKFAMQYIQATKDATILDYITHDIRALNCDIPSWVPRWDIQVEPKGRAREGVYDVLTSRAEFESAPRFINDATLQVRGVVMDTIKYASNIFQRTAMTPEVIRDVWNSVKIATAISPYGASSVLEAFLGTLTLGRYFTEWTEWQHEFAADIKLTYLDMDEREVGPDSVLELRKQSRIFYDLLVGHISDMRFIVTKRGYMGLAPAVTEEGDECAIIFGCGMPCVLRLAANQDHYHHLGGTFLMGKEPTYESEGTVKFHYVLGDENSKDWLDWDVEEQDIYLC